MATQLCIPGTAWTSPQERCTITPDPEAPPPANPATRRGCIPYGHQLTSSFLFVFLFQVVVAGAAGIHHRAPHPAAGQGARAARGGGGAALQPPRRAARPRVPPPPPPPPPGCRPLTAFLPFRYSTITILLQLAVKFIYPSICQSERTLQALTCLLLAAGVPAVGILATAGGAGSDVMVAAWGAQSL